MELDPRADPSWRGLAGESSTSAQQLGAGVTALGKASYARQAHYVQAFFALTIGFERACKLAIALDYALDHGGQFPERETFRKYGHDLALLLGRVDEIAQMRAVPRPYNRLPDTPIHQALIAVLSDFANNVTRYYDLESLSGDTKVLSRVSPVAAWFEKVTRAVLEKHYGSQHRKRHETNAEAAAVLLDGIASVRYRAETGEFIDTAFKASRRTGENEFAKRWERMYILQVARFVATVLVHLGELARAAGINAPYLNEFFGQYLNDDAFLRSHSSW